jgi:hypothetical protein
LDHEIQRYDPYYIPFYAKVVVWLAKQRTHDPALPRPEIWLTDWLKPGLLEWSMVETWTLRSSLSLALGRSSLSALAAKQRG